MAILNPQQTVGLSAALLNGNMDELLDKSCHMILEADLQQLDQGLFIQPKETQGRQDEVPNHACC